METEDLLDLIKEILSPEFKDGMVDVSLSGIRDNIHVVVMSRLFDNMPEWKKQETVSTILKYNSNLTDKEKQRISLIVALSPEDVK